MPTLDFDNLFKKIKKISGGKNQKGVAEKLGISPQAITDAKKKNKIPETWFDIVLEKFGVTKEELCLKEESKIGLGASLARDSLARPLHKGKEASHCKPVEKDIYDQIIDEFFELIKEWQIEENGRSARTAINFIQEFPKRFGEMADWQKNQKCDNPQNQLTDIKFANGND